MDESSSYLLGVPLVLVPGGTGSLVTGYVSGPSHG